MLMRGITPLEKHGIIPSERSKWGGIKLNLKKNPHTPVYGFKEFDCLSVSLSVAKFDLNYLRTGEIEWPEIFL